METTAVTINSMDIAEEEREDAEGGDEVDSMDVDMGDGMDLD